MKRQQKSFSVEIKKSRTPGPRHHLPPRHLFATPPDVTSAFIQTAEPQDVGEDTAAPRILPSIIEPVPGNPEPVETARRKRPSGEADRGQLDFNLTAAASGDVKDACAEAPASANTLPQADNASVDAEDALPIHDVQPAQGNGVKIKSWKPQKKASETVEREMAPEPIPEAEMPAPSAESQMAQRRMTKRRAAAAQLPRHERWKGRLHPAAW